MRWMLPTLLAIGCADPGSLASGGVLDVATRGVQVTDDGTSAHAAMYDVTCSVTTRNGNVAADSDYPGDSEVVHDYGTFGDKDVVVVSSATGVHVDDPGGWFDEEIGVARYAYDDVAAATLADDDVVVLHTDPVDGCTLSWGETGDTLVLDASACATASLSADPVFGDAFTIVQGQAIHVGRDGTTEVVASDVDLVEWDPATDRVYTAQTGEAWVSASTASGEALWSTDLGAPVVDLDALGFRGGVAVVVDLGTSNEVWVLDADSGDATLADETPAGIEGITVSRNGRSLALITDSQVHFREIERHDRD